MLNVLQNNEITYIQQNTITHQIYLHSLAFSSLPYLSQEIARVSFPIALAPAHLQEEGEGAGRIVVAAGQRQPIAPNVAAAAMKLIIPAVQRKEEGKGAQGQPGTGVTGHVGTGGRRGGTEAAGHEMERTGGCARGQEDRREQGGGGMKERGTGAPVATAPAVVWAAAPRITATGQRSGEGEGGG